MKLRRSAALVTAFLVAGVALAVTPGTSAAGPPVARDAAVIVRWNEIADRTLAENAVPVPASSLYLGFAALAVYDAVVAIEGRYEPWADQPRPHANASPEVAAATAAYHVLRHYFPNSANALAADYAASLASVPNGVGKEHGTRVGEAAAARLIAQRSGDGRNALVPQPGDGTPGAGDWRPTASGPMAVPWLGFVDPLVLPSPTPIPLAGPPALESADYAADFAEVRDYGGSTSLRSSEQTATALFWNVNPVRQYNTAMRDQVSDRGLDIVDSARAFALLHSSTADALIACWWTKYDVNFWRPETAIALADTDGNDATDVVPGWTPHRPSPPYSDYTSGHACVTGATTGVLEHLFGSSLQPALDVPSLVLNVPSRPYADTGALDAEAMNARIWLGYHFRAAMTDGNALGHAVAEHAAANDFQAAA